MNECMHCGDRLVTGVNHPHRSDRPNGRICKPCYAAIRKKHDLNYWERHPEARAIHRRKWKDKNHDHVLRYHSEYYAANRVRILAEAKARRRAEKLGPTQD